MDFASIKTCPGWLKPLNINKLQRLIIVVLCVLMALAYSLSYIQTGSFNTKAKFEERRGHEIVEVIMNQSIFLTSLIRGGKSL